MAIENRLPQKQKARSAIDAKGLISITKEVDDLCRPHQCSHVVATPAWTPILTGVKIRTAKAAQTFQSYYRAFAVLSQGESYSDLPQLPNRM